MAKTFLDKKFCSWCGGKLQKVDENQLRCQACQKPEFNSPKACVVALIINPAGEILVSTRKYDPGAGMLDLPGGFIEGSESAIDCLIRELQEETDILVSAKDLEQVASCAHEYIYADVEHRVIDIFFRYDAPEDLVFTAHDDVVSLGWRKPRELNDSDFPYPELIRTVKAYLQPKNML